ncbi:MAG: hypothetical protein ACRDSK_17460, partial [Actinophytocola sp.]|uniref:hypothetical protein n=1 Tax=Actinophytocola sp. TaxID=1872138 RepID=UPI003D6A76D8
AAAATTALVAVAVVLGSPDDAGRNTGDDTTTAPASPTSVSAAKPAACQDTPLRKDPPLNFPGSAEIVERLNRSVPEAVGEHLAGGSVERSDPMLAMDCPPTLVSGYFVGDTSIALFLIHARPELDDARDRYADAFPVTDEFTAEDGALIRVYEVTKGAFDGKVSNADRGLIVTRFGTDGMVAQTSISPRSSVAVADVVALLGDPRLHFPIPQ